MVCSAGRLETNIRIKGDDVMLNEYEAKVLAETVSKSEFDEIVAMHQKEMREKGIIAESSYPYAPAEEREDKPLSQGEGKAMIKERLHNQICSNLHTLYAQKNADYGDSFSKVRTEFPNAVLVRLSDKLERLKTLYGKPEGEQEVVDESIDDTLLDLANYALMETVERIIDRTSEKK